MKARVMATAFLLNGGKLLLMKRSETRELAPGLWAGVGGHLEPEELQVPMKACLREIFEETGIQECEICSLSLKYITLRLKADRELRTQYVYFGTTSKVELPSCDEGELFWVELQDLFDRDMYPTTRFILEHYFTTGIYDHSIYTGTMYEMAGKPAIQWYSLSDWDEV